MGYDGSGNFTRLYSWQDDRDNDIAIRADRMDAEFANFVTGLNAVILRNGVAAMTGDLNMGLRRIIALSDGTNASPAVKFSTDGTSGLYLPGAGRVALAAGGVNRIEGNSAGAVVTGTLEVSGSTTLNALDVSSAFNVEGVSSFNDTVTLATPLAVTSGGTGGNTAANARTALGVVIGTDVQAYHANLAALAGLSFIADRLPYGNGTGTLALATFTSFGRSLIDDADAAAARSTLGLGALSLLGTINGSNWSGADLAVVDGGTGASDASGARTNFGLVIGTNVQAYNANLAALAGLSIIGDTVPYGSGSGTMALTAFTAVGRTLAGLANAAAGRTALGLVIGTDVAAVTSPTFAGAPLAPTAAAGTATTQLATTAFVDRLRDVPIAAALGERGAVAVLTTGDTINTGYAAGTTFSIYNESAGNITITAGGGLTLRLGGTATTGNRTISQRGMATIWCRSTTEYIMSGSGVS